jgi:hypothetical protein
MPLTQARVTLFPHFETYASRQPGSPRAALLTRLITKGPVHSLRDQPLRGNASLSKVCFSFSGKRG